MNLTKREFMQVIGAGSMAGLNLNAYATADTAVASKGCLLYTSPSPRDH
jgi:sulfur-oxidizing protein SoxB